MAENGSKQLVLSKQRLPVVVELANVPQREMRWLWPGKIPLGKLTLLAGDPELGKSFLTIDMAARVTRRPTRDVPHLLKGGREVARQRAMAAVPPTTSPRGT